MIYYYYRYYYYYSYIVKDDDVNDVNAVDDNQHQEHGFCTIDSPIVSLLLRK